MDIGEIGEEYTGVLEETAVSEQVVGKTRVILQAGKAAGCREQQVPVGGERGSSAHSGVSVLDDGVLQGTPLPHLTWGVAGYGLFTNV